MQLKDLEGVPYNPTTEKLLNILRTKTQNYKSDLYFRVLITFYLAQMASSMRVTVKTPHRGKLPINVFACCLAESGAGKGHSMNILEQSVIKKFKNRFMQYTFPAIAEQNIEAQALRNSNIHSTEYEEELDELMKEFKSYGSMPYSFDSGTGPAFKQIRTKAQIGRIGSLNMVCDEIGTNLLTNAELFAVNLEAYDVGLIKQKIIKNSTDNKRAVERDEPVPSNMLVFGTPVKLFNGGKEEREWDSLLDTGYARRFIFATGEKDNQQDLTAEKLLDALLDTSIDATITQLSDYFENLADPVNYERNMGMSRDVTLINLQYQIECEAKAALLSDFETIQRNELSHRYFRAIKLAGAYAFVEGTGQVTEDHMYSAIKLIEESGKGFQKILTRDRNYARVAKYIAAVKRDITPADLVEDLPFFPSGTALRNDMITLATAWGYRNNILIKRSVSDGVEFFRGESLKETDLNSLTVAYSNDIAYGYKDASVSFDKLHKLTQAPGYHWITHHVIDGHRCDEAIKKGFDCIVIDSDAGINLRTAQLLLEKYKAHYHTTKRHTEDKHRFRIVLPMKYRLELNSDDFKEFMNNVFDWLPFGSDEQVGQRARKWAAHAGWYENTEGMLFDPLPFIPKTDKNEKRKEIDKKLGNMTSVDKFFASQWSEGGRNNTLIRYGLMCLDGGNNLADVQDQVITFNNQFGKDALPEREILATVFKTLAKKSQ